MTDEPTQKTPDSPEAGPAPPTAWQRFLRSPWPGRLAGFVSLGWLIARTFEAGIAEWPSWLLIALGASTLGFLLVALYATRDPNQPSPTIDPSERLRQRINAVNRAVQQANVAFIEAGKLTDELRREVAVQQTAHQQLTEEAERQRTLIAMDREEAEAVQALILGNTEADKRRQRRREWMFFLAGLLFAVPLNILSELIGPK